MNMQSGAFPKEFKPRVVAWELTRSCNLACAHCRASANYRSYPGELSNQECFRIVDEIVAFAKPILILTGGEPMLHPDFFTIASYAAGKGLRVAVGSNGTLLDREMVARMKDVPISRLGVSLDFPVADLHDRFRGVPGAFEKAVKGIELARQAGIEVQVNCTITKRNAQYVEDLLSFALSLGAVAFHPFFLVPTGRGKELMEEELDGVEYERLLRWVYRKQKELGSRLFFKPTDAPHYMRVVLQERKKEAGSDGLAGGSHGAGGELSTLTRGCLAGVGFCFISHRGKIQGCGYLNVEAGDLRERSFEEIWQNSPLFQRLRNLSLLQGKCGVCDFKEVCGGCRARALETSGNYLAEEPYCVYKPPLAARQKVESKKG